MQLFKLLSFLIFLLNMSSGIYCQQLEETKLKKIDSLFDGFTEGPPISYGVLYKNQSISRQFSAEEYRCKDKFQNQYRLGGMTPHFVAYAILLLEERKLLNLEDKISNYLDISTTLEYKDLTIKDLLSHNHGLPEYWSLKEFMGYKHNRLFTSDIVNEAFESGLKRIHTKGERVSFSGTGAFILAKVIKKVSGKNLAEFAQENMFLPLNMHNTYFTNATSLANIISYEKQGEGYEPLIVKHRDNGPAGLVTTIDDLLIWFDYLSDQSIAINKKMNTPIPLKNGGVVEIENGKITYGQQFMHGERGLNKIWDYGHIGGFASSVFIFPEKELTILLLGKNGLSYNAYLGMEIAEILLKDEFEPEPEADKVRIRKVNNKHIDNFVGSYISSDNGYYYRQIRFRNDTLRFYNPASNWEIDLFPIDKNELIMLSPGGNQKFKIQNNTLYQTWENFTYIYEKLEGEDVQSFDIKYLPGTYLCKELQLILTIKKGKNDNFILLDKETEVPLHFIGGHKMIAYSHKFKYITVQQNPGGKMISLKISNIGLKDVEFKKVL